MKSQPHQIITTLGEFPYITSTTFASSHGDGSWKELWIHISATDDAIVAQWAVVEKGSKVTKFTSFPEAAHYYNSLP